MEENDFRDDMNKDEKTALKQRVDNLKDKYSNDEIERIIFTELNEIGLNSEEYIDMLDTVMS